MKFIKIAAFAVFAVSTLSLGACASKPKPAPAPVSMGTSK
jgi:hypothetical protein